MKFKSLVTKAGLTLRKHSPEILGAIGMVATIGGVVWACKASVDAADDIKKCREDVEEIKTARDELETIDKKEAAKRIWSARVDCMRKVGVKYVGPVAVIGVGLYCQHKGKRILNKRMNSLAAAYTALEARYKLLEDNVRRDYGEDELARLKYGLRSQKGIVRVPDDVGNDREVEETVTGVGSLEEVKPFTIVFDNRSAKHRTSKYHCESFLNSKEDTFTDLLRIKKQPIWLDWAMEQLDIHPKDAAEARLWHHICWTYKPGAPDADNVVRFRYRQVIDPDADRFDMDYNPVYILDPNYDTNFYQDWYRPKN